MSVSLKDEQPQAELKKQSRVQHKEAKQMVRTD